MDLITLKNVRYLDRCHNITLTLGDKKLVGIIGPNGAGKSTLLKLMAGLLQPSQGDVYFNDINLKQLSRKERATNISWVPQVSEIGWPISVYDAVMIGAQYQSTPAKHTELAIECCKLNGLTSRPLDQLSGGELARVWIARALAGTPRVLLADEPIASLDLKYQIELMKIFKGFAKYDCLAVVVLHDINLAARFCDEVILVDQGGIIAVGPTKDVLSAQRLSDVFDVDISKFTVDQQPLFVAKGRLSND